MSPAICFDPEGHTSQPMIHHRRSLVVQSPPSRLNICTRRGVYGVQIAVHAAANAKDLDPTSLFTTCLNHDKNINIPKRIREEKENKTKAQREKVSRRVGKSKMEENEALISGLLSCSTDGSTCPAITPFVALLRLSFLITLDLTDLFKLRLRTSLSFQAQL